MLNHTRRRLNGPGAEPGAAWRLMARHTAPEFGEDEAQALLDHVHLGGHCCLDYTRHYQTKHYQTRAAAFVLLAPRTWVRGRRPE